MFNGELISDKLLIDTIDDMINNTSLTKTEIEDMAYIELIAYRNVRMTKLKKEASEREDQQKNYKMPSAPNIPIPTMPNIPKF